MAHGTSGNGFVLREVDRGAALDFTKHAAVNVPLPAGFENVVGAYPEAITYQTTAPGGVNVALVANGHENVNVGVFATPP